MAPRTLLLLLVPAVLAAGLLAACGSESSEGGGEDGPPTTPAPDRGSGSGAGTSTPSSDGEASSSGGRALADGELQLRVERGRVFLSATVAEPAVVLRDLSLATTTPSGSRWDVLVTRPVGPRSDQADLPDTYEGVVARPGQPVEVGVFELGPRPPDEVTLCVEVAPLPADQAEAEAGATVLLPPGDDGDEPTYLCATTPVD